MDRKRRLMENNNGWPLRSQLFDGAPFRLPLTHTAVPASAATGTTATFTRATAKTWPNNDGYLVTGVAGEIGFVGARRVRNLVATTSEDFSNAAWTKTNTTVIANQTAAPNGTLTADLLYPTTTGTLRFTSQTIFGVSLVGTTVLVISVYAKSAGMSWMYLGLPGTGANQGAYFNLSTGAIGTIKAGASNVTMTAVGNGWYRCSLTQLDTVDTGAYPVISVADADNSTTATTNGTDGIYIWGAQLEDVTAQTTQTAGEYVSVGVTSAPYYHGSAADGVRAYPYDLSGNPIPSTTLLGYSAEGARTNLCLQSNAFTTTWVNNAALTVAQNSTGPDNTTSAWALTQTAGSLRFLTQTIGTLTANNYTLSFFVAKTIGAQATYPVFNLYAAVPAKICGVTVDTTNGVATVWTAWTGLTVVTSSATCVSYSANYWRVSLTGLLTTDSWRVTLLPAGATSATQATGEPLNTTAGSAVFYGAQVELGSFASSYIATTTIAVARNADVLTYSSAGNISGTVGWVHLEYLPPSTTITQAALLDPCGATGRSPLYRSNSRTLSMYDGTTVLNGTTMIPVVQYKLAASWGSNQACSVNGAAVISDAFDGDYTIAANIAIGSYSDGSSGAFGTIRNVRIGQRQLSSSEQQAITA